MREKKWAAKRLKAIGKGDALERLEAEKHRYTPFEMSLLLNPVEVSTATETRIARFGRFMESIRNMLVVVPLMLTWFSLALASAAYQQSLSAPKPLGEPFLQQWQEGFPAIKVVALAAWHIPLLAGRTRWFTFSSFALADAVLLTMLFALTVVGQLVDYWAYQRGNRLARYAETFLYRLNLDALSMTREPNADGLPPWLRELQSRLGQLGDIIQKMNDALDSSLGSYIDAIGAQEQAVKDLVEDSDRVHTSVKELNVLFQRGAEAARVYQQSIPLITRQFGDLAADQRTSTEALQGMTDMLSHSMRYLGELAGQIREAEGIIQQYQGVIGRPAPRPPRPMPSIRWRQRQEPRMTFEGYEMDPRHAMPEEPAPDEMSEQWKEREDRRGPFWRLSRARGHFWRRGK